MGEEAPSRNWKKGCLWIVGAAVGGLILLGVIAGTVDPDMESGRAGLETKLAEASATPTTDGSDDPIDAIEKHRYWAINALEEARDTLTHVESDAWDKIRQAGYDAAYEAFEMSIDSENDDAWATAWIAFTVTQAANLSGRLAITADDKADYEFAASLGGSSREHCEALNYAEIQLREASVLYDVAIAAWSNEVASMSEVTVVRANLGAEVHDCSELEPLKLGAGGSSMEPDMTYDFAAENASYFTGRCGRQVSQIMPVVEQQRCFSTGEKAFRFFLYWVPQSDPEWVNASQDRRAQLERAAETYRRNVESTLETLGWMRGGMPSFTALSIN